MATDPIFMFLLRNPRVLLAFAQISLMWLSHLRFSVLINGHSEVFGRGNSGEYMPMKFVLCL